MIEWMNASATAFFHSIICQSINFFPLKRSQAESSLKNIMTHERSLRWKNHGMLATSHLFMRVRFSVDGFSFVLDHLFAIDLNKSY